MAKESIPEEVLPKVPSYRELKGVSRALDDYKKEIAQYQKLPVTADCLLETLEIERSFRKAITSDIRALVEINCSSCPMDYTRETCEVEACPFRSISNILNERLKQLDQILPGGIKD